MVEQTVKAINAVEGKTDLVAADTNALRTSASALNLHLSDVKEDIRMLKAAIETSDRKRSLEFALQNIRKFFALHSTVLITANRTHSSTGLIKTILLSFRKNLGHYLPFNAALRSRDCQVDQEQKKKVFRDALVDQLHDWTGIKPRIVLTEDKRYAIYYS